MDANESPIAQGQQAEAEIPNGSDGQSVETPAPNEGFQKRIAELVGQRKQTEEELIRERAQAQAKEQEYLRVIAQLSAQGSQPQNQEPQIDIDPEERKKIEAVFGPKLKAMEAAYARLEAQTAEQQVRAHAQAQYGDADIGATAAKLVATWKANNYTGWKPEDAVIYAMGQKAAAELAKKTQARDEKGRFNRTSDTMLTGNAAPPPAPSTGRPANFEQLSDAKQLEILERTLAGKTF